MSPGAASTPCPACGGASFAPFCAVPDRLRRLPEPVWTIERCAGCGYGRTVPVPAEEEIAAFYPEGYLGDTPGALEAFLAGRLQRTRSWRAESEKAWFLGQFVRRGRVLDVGCGDGRFLWALDPASWERFGLDIAEPVMARVRDRIPSIRLLSGDIRDAPLSASSFDAVTFWHSLEHLPDPAAALARAAALLRPGGWIVVSLPNIDSIQAALFRGCWYPMDDVPRHLHHFSRRALDLMMDKAGFRVESHACFSARVAYHSLKHSLLNWAAEGHGGRAAYYLLKPLIFLIPLLERATGRCAILTTAARRP